MPLRFFHTPTNNIFPKDWVTKQAQDSYIKFVMPYYAVACKAGSRKQFLEALYLIWFNRFPVIVESEDPYEMSLAIDVQQDVCIIIISPWVWLKAAQFLADKLLWAGACKTDPPTDRWEDVIDLEADRASRVGHLSVDIERVLIRFYSACALLRLP